MNVLWINLNRYPAHCSVPIALDDVRGTSYPNTEKSEIGHITESNEHNKEAAVMNYSLMPNLIVPALGLTKSPSDK